jgi:hypothetical protein
VRDRRAVHPGDVVGYEAVAVRLRRRMGVLKGIARVDGKVVVAGTMAFALASAAATQSGPEGADPAERNLAPGRLLSPPPRQ